MITLMLINTLIISAYAQLSDDTMKQLTNGINHQKTANSKDILTTFFRAGVENLLGDDHKFTLSSSFFGIDSAIRKKGAPTYNKERKLRNNSLDFALTSDEFNNLNKFNLGFTFSVINRTNLTQNKLKASDAALLKEVEYLINAIQIGFVNVISTTRPKDYNDFATNTAFMKSWSEANKNHSYKDLHSLITEALKDPSYVQTLLNDPKITNKPTQLALQNAITLILEGVDPFIETYTNIASEYARKPILTFSPTSAYDRSTKQGEYGFASDFTVGLSKNPKKKPLEIEAKLRLKIGNDTTINNVNYENKPFSFSVGVNQILSQNEQKESKLEFKLFTQYDHQFGSAKKVSDAELFTLNSTLRINIYKSLWLPLSIKYDPKNGNLFGYFSFTANIGN